eukprot:s6679_g1.t1
MSFLSQFLFALRTLTAYALLMTPSPIDVRRIKVTVWRAPAANPRRRSLTAIQAQHQVIVLPSAGGVEQHPPCWLRGLWSRSEGEGTSGGAFG